MLMCHNSLSLHLLDTKAICIAHKDARTSLLQKLRVNLRSCKRISCEYPLNKSIDSFVEFQVQQFIERQPNCWISRKDSLFDLNLLRGAYESCRKICANNAKSYYLGTLLFPEKRKRAIWAIYAWCRRTDDLVDGVNANVASLDTLDTWEKRLEDIFDGRPHDILDIALAHTVQQFPLDIKPFKDLIKGMRMDTWKTRYQNYEELELYSYYVAGTVGLMTVPIAGVSPDCIPSTQNVYKAAVFLGIGNQLTNIIRDVVEDATMGRVYLPQDELREFGLTDEDIFSQKVTEEWREFTKKQIQRAKYYYSKAEEGVSQLDSPTRWPVWAALILYRRLLDKIEQNNYDNLTMRAAVGDTEKLLALPLAYTKSLGW